LRDGDIWSMNLPRVFPNIPAPDRNPPRTMTPTEDIIRLGQIEIRFLLEGKDSNGQLATFEFTVPAGAKVPVPHYHERYDETIYGLEGVITFTVEGRPVDIAPGQTCFIPRGAVHGFNNLKPSTARALAIITPALLGPAFFREMAAVIHAGGPPDVEKMKAVMTRHGLVPAAPAPPAA
jgi:quercetin dioxygenase-like cupin family protein